MMVARFSAPPFRTQPMLGGIGSGRSPHLGAASKCEHWRSIDLADLKRMGLLKPILGDRIRAIMWKTDHGGLHKLGIIPSARGVQFVKRDDEGKLAGLFVAYTYTPKMFGGYRKWFACPECRRPARIVYGVNSLRCRRCRGLRYASQSEASHWQAQRKAITIRSRLNASNNTLDGPFPPKPPKMSLDYLQTLASGRCSPTGAMAPRRGRRRRAA